MGEVVHRLGLSSARLDMADNNSFEVVTGRDGVHCHVLDGAPCTVGGCPVPPPLFN